MAIQSRPRPSPSYDPRVIALPRITRTGLAIMDVADRKVSAVGL